MYNSNGQSSLPAFSVSRIIRSGRIKKGGLEHLLPRFGSTGRSKSKSAQRVSTLSIEEYASVALMVDFTRNRSTQAFGDPTPPEPRETDWDAVYLKAEERHSITTDNCAICIAPLTNQSGQRKQKRLTLLSCTHVFHATCLSRFEFYDVSLFCHVCPVCRTEYERISL